MPLINTATNLYLGGTQVKAVYRNGVLVWPPGSGNRVNASLALKTGSTVTLTVSWAGDVPTSWKAWVSINGAAWQYWTEQTAADSYDYATTYSTRIKMKVEAYYSGFAPDIAVYTEEVTIGAAPPPPTKQSVVTLGAVWWGSYNKSGLRPTNTDGTPISTCYYGNYGTTHGDQSSLAKFDIPAGVRNCISVDAVEIRWWNRHHFESAGGRVSMVGHHWSDRPSTFGGTNRLMLNGTPVNWAAPVGGWINGGSTEETSWYHIGSLTAPYEANSRTVNEEIRIAGMTGFGLVSAEDGRAGYGYASTDPELRITYTHYT